MAPESKFYTVALNPPPAKAYPNTCRLRSLVTPRHRRNHALPQFKTISPAGKALVFVVALRPPVTCLSSFLPPSLLSFFPPPVLSSFSALLSFLSCGIPFAALLWLTSSSSETPSTLLGLCTCSHLSPPCFPFLHVTWWARSDSVAVFEKQQNQNHDNKAEFWTFLACNIFVHKHHEYIYLLFVSCWTRLSNWTEPNWTPVSTLTSWTGQALLYLQGPEYVDPNPCLLSGLNECLLI